MWTSPCLPKICYVYCFQTAVFWILTTCSVGWYRRFGGTCSFDLGYWQNEIKFILNWLGVGCLIMLIMRPVRGGTAWPLVSVLWPLEGVFGALIGQFSRFTVSVVQHKAVSSCAAGLILSLLLLRRLLVQCNRLVTALSTFRRRTGHEDPQGQLTYSSTLFLTSALDGGGWSTSRPGRFTPGKDPVPVV